MKKTISKFLIAIFSFVFVLVPFTQVAFAQDGVTGPVDQPNLLCQIFPFVNNIGFASSLCGGDVEGQAEGTVNYVANLVRFGLSLVFIGIIGIAIFTIVKAALKYIRSEGDEGKIEESTKAIKAVFIGIGALIVGIIGLVIILAFFNASGTLQPTETPDLNEVI